MRTVVFDTNIYVSAFVTPGGRGESAYRMAVDGRVKLSSSVPILAELARILQYKFNWDADRVTAAIRHVAAVATVLKPTARLAILRDEPDNRILECALAAGADVIVTGDRHLLDLGKYEGIAIEPLAVFLE